ncbi:hypothetical protein KZZ04_07760 [Pseudoalteromonas sp. CR1]|uniref:hypothetical protein n=1 Tax=Pseudoalteromonas sp. CR1 TaxID=2861964 RepID=UPI001C6013B2|nr:hypothetical protein [Pseudoalteromonas sp. CR1]MBW4966260.1 hypothetical protein [Pseudoalteromonas sp. CR1]
MSYSFEDKDLTSEKSLWDVYKLSRRILPNKFQVIFLLLIMLALGFNAFVLVDDKAVILGDVRKWSEFGFNFSITTLGFLIAGFTIFATLSKPKMMLAMMEHTNRETGLPTLKYNFFTFMKVFIAYIAISIFYLLVMILGQADGFISNVVTLLPNEDCVKSILIKTAYTLIGSSFVYLLLLLKSFVFNIYAIVMNFLRWEYHEG